MSPVPATLCVASHAKHTLLQEADQSKSVQEEEATFMPRANMTVALVSSLFSCAVVCMCVFLYVRLLVGLHVCVCV